MRNRLTAVGDPEPVDAVVEMPQLVAPLPPSRASAAITDGLMLALKALSQRALVALAALEHLILAGSVFAIWLRVIAEPSELQLVGVGGYAAFVLLLVWMRNRS
jgi:hypothetical protein